MSTAIDGSAVEVPRGRSESLPDVPAPRGDVFVGAIQLEIGLPRDAKISARMTLKGEPDAICATEVAEVLTLIEANVQVDVRACVPLESAIVATLARAVHELDSRGHSLEVIVPPGDTRGARALSRSAIPAAWLRVEACSYP